MTNPNRYAVPLEVLDGVRVGVAHQVQEQTTSRPDDAPLWGGAVAPAADGGGDGDGD